VGFPETVEKQPELIAHHLAEAGLGERAIEYLQKAGRRAIERSANTEAIGQLTRARELLQSLPPGVERGRAALGLEVMLGQAMIADRGYAATETRETLLRAKMLINESTNPSHKSAVLYGVWASLYVGGEVSKQLEAATEFLAEAEQQNETGVLCIAHRILGTTYVTMGEFARGLHHLKRAQALYASEHHLHYRHQYGQDIGAATLCYLSWSLWHLGYLDQASAVAADAVQHAKEVSHPHTLVYTLCHARGFMDLFRQHDEDIPSYTGLINSLCTENRFSHWINCGRVLEGWAEVCQGNVDQGIALLRTGMVAWQKAGAHLWLPMFLTLEAKACAKSGRAEAALEAIEKAIAISTDTGERWMMPEVLRVKARLLQARGRAEAGQIETILCHSLEIARAQGARCWELRASCELARLWQGQNRVEEALRVLQSIYDQFTEGFDTRDLQNAKALVENLRRSAGLKVGDGAGKNSDETHAVHLFY